MIFGFETGDNLEVVKFIKDTNNRLKDKVFLSGTLSFKRKDSKFIVLADLTLTELINPLWIAGFASFVIILFFGLSLLLLFPLFIASIALLKTRYFFFAVCYRGLRKGGYEGKINFLSYEQLMRGWLGLTSGNF